MNAFDPKTITTYLDDVGPWSYFCLCEVAFKKFFPEYRSIYKNDCLSGLNYMNDIINSPESWRNLIIEYHQKFGFQNSIGKNIKVWNTYVNRY